MPGCVISARAVGLSNRRAMMLIDTDVVIWATRGDASAVQTVDAIDQPALSIVTVIELMQGARDARELENIERGLDNWGVNVVPINAATGNIARDLIRDHVLSDGLFLADALIAATAIHNELTLLSGNRKHFEKIERLDFRAFMR